MVNKKKRGSGENLKEHLELAVFKESRKCEECYAWLEQNMPQKFFEEVSEEDVLLIAHSLMGFDLQEYFAHIHLKNSAITLCLDSLDADLRILKRYQQYGIKDYRTFISKSPPPFSGINAPLVIAFIFYTTSPDIEKTEKILDTNEKKEIKDLVKERNPNVTDEEFKLLLQGMSPRFLRSITKDRLIMALDMFFRAKSRDTCQYEVIRNTDWDKSKDVETPSLRIVLAWRNVPKHHFLYNFAKVVYRHGLNLRRVSATYINPYTPESILIMSVALHGSKGEAAWEACDLHDFLQEVVTLKYFEGQNIIEKRFVDSGLVRGNIGNLIKTISLFVHQILTQDDCNMYSLNNIEEGLCRHPELTQMLTKAFEYKLNPKTHNLKKFEKIRDQFFKLVNNLDTGNEEIDTRRKNILRQGMNFVIHILKTNFYRRNKTAFSFRLDPKYLTYLPYDRTQKFPEIPYAIFFIKGMFYIGFHIRFKDLARGGLRTVFPQKMEQMLWERNNIFIECYNLAYTQQKKNKDIPEGGAKGVIFLEPIDHLAAEVIIYREELKQAGFSEDQIKNYLISYRKEQKLEYLYSAQRSFIEALVTLINCEEDGRLRAKHIVDYYKKPEYIYLGPDENMHNHMIEWIARYANYYNYKPGGCFISSKPSAGINHKEYGVTSYGITVCMEEALKFLGFNPFIDSFTIKISGGPDGDVAGNMILNLHKYYPKTAKLLALTDVSGTIYDPKGLDLNILVDMFYKEQPIKEYPPKKLHNGGFLLDLTTKKEETIYVQKTLLYRKKEKKVIQEWLSGNEMNYLFRSNIHQTHTDIFVPGGGRPRTLHDHNWKDYLDETGIPTSNAIVEGANLYLTPIARRELEKLGVLIIKDSSANKGGVICSSFEVLAGLILNEKEFVKKKEYLMPEILEIIKNCARDEAQLMLETHAESGTYLTDISEWISDKINNYKHDLLNFLEEIELSKNPETPLIQCLLNYCPPLLKNKYQNRIIQEIPDIHVKAIIATYLASRLVYRRGLSWSPSIVDILPLIANDPDLLTD